MHHVFFPTAAHPHLQTEGTWTWQKLHHAPNRCQPGYLGRPKSQCALQHSSKSFSAFQKAGCCSVTGLKLCSQSSSDISFVWKMGHSLHRGFTPACYKKSSISALPAYAEMTSLSELANLQETDCLKYFKFLNTCFATWGKRPRKFMSCEEELQWLPSLTIFLNISEIGGSPN